MIPIVVANRTRVLGLAVSEALRPYPEVEVVASTDRLEHALEAAREVVGAVLIADGDLVAAASPEVLRALRASKLIVLVNDLDDDWPAQVAESGAAAYVTLDADGDDLIRAVRLSSGARLVVQAAMPRAGLARLAAGSSKDGPAGGLLSARELAVLRAIAEGASDAAVAARLGIAVATVKVHLRSVLRKAGVANRAGAVAWGYRTGVLE